MPDTMLIVDALQIPTTQTDYLVSILPRHTFNMWLTTLLPNKSIYEEQALSSLKMFLFGYERNRINILCNVEREKGNVGLWGVNWG